MIVNNVKNFENQKVIAKSLVASFFGTRCSCAVLPKKS